MILKAFIIKLRFFFLPLFHSFCIELLLIFHQNYFHFPRKDVWSEAGNDRYFTKLLASKWEKMQKMIKWRRDPWQGLGTGCSVSEVDLQPFPSWWGCSPFLLHGVGNDTKLSRQNMTPSVMTKCHSWDFFGRQMPFRSTEREFPDSFCLSMASASSQSVCEVPGVGSPWSGAVAPWVLLLPWENGHKTREGV